ncbi:MAG: arginyltransferase [Polyangiaceae bacterium]
MARVLDVLTDNPHRCSYLADRDAVLSHRIMVEVSAEELDDLLVRGWRRFGPDYFRPVCPTCSECVPTRVPTETFTPSKSQRRAAKACASLELRLGPPRFDARRLALYRKWHAYRESSRGWDESELNERSYRLQFAFPHPAARELVYVDPATDELVGVGICDQTPRAWSAVYFFYDPAWAKRSIGTANVVFQIELARSLGIPHVYLGFSVAGCPSLAYKNTFRPQETLRNWPADDEPPDWQLAAESRDPAAAIVRDV